MADCGTFGWGKGYSAYLQYHLLLSQNKTERQSAHNQEGKASLPSILQTLLLLI